MASENHSRSEGDSNHESIEIDPPETSQGRTQDLEEEGNDLWAALRQQAGSSECLIISIILLLMVIFIILVVNLVLVFTGDICQ